MRFNERFLIELGFTKADIATLRSILTTSSATGTMGAQDADSVNIDGGAIDGTVIGGNTPAAGSFTTLAGALSTAAQPNITSLGAIVALIVTSGVIDNAIIGGTTKAAGSFTALVNTGLHTRSATASITAFATGGQTGAIALTTDINEVSTVTTTADSVKLPAASAGLFVTIINNGANACDIYPASGDNLGAGADTAVSLAAGSNINYTAYNGINWESV